MFTAITLILNASTVVFNESDSLIENIRVQKEPSSTEIKVNETEVIIPVQVLIQNGTATIGMNIQGYMSKLLFKKRFTHAVKTRNLLYCYSNTCIECGY